MELEKRPVERCILTFEQPPEEEAHEHRKENEDEDEDVSEGRGEIRRHFPLENDPDVFHVGKGECGGLAACLDRDLSEHFVEPPLIDVKLVKLELAGRA